MARMIPPLTDPQQQIPLPADDDLVLVADDGQVYWLQKSEYTDERFRVDQTGAMTDDIDMLVHKGAILAFVPAAKKESIGAACYLINLRDLRQPSDKPRHDETEEPAGDEAAGGLQ